VPTTGRVMKKSGLYFGIALAIAVPALGGETTVLSLKDYCGAELKSSGLAVSAPTTIHIRALGAGGDYGWTYKSDRMFAYGWIINADTRDLIWMMDTHNTTRKDDDREFKGDLTLEPGSYEVYFTVYAFTFHSTFSHVTVNMDHRKTPLFSDDSKDQKKNFMSWFKNWWTDDVEKAWSERCKRWGIEIGVDEAAGRAVKSFEAPKPRPDVGFSVVKVGDRAVIRQEFSQGLPTTLSIYALGERGNDKTFADYGWIVDTRDRRRVWEMEEYNCTPAGGAKKNIMFRGDVKIDPGQYVLYYITDDSHSSADWNDEPPYDPLNYGISISVRGEKERKAFQLEPYTELTNVIVSLTKAGDNESRSEGFTLKTESSVRVYAIGERDNNGRRMADYGVILDAKIRNRVWTMDAGRTMYAGGASKNRYIDEVITLPAGSYLVQYVTDDSHAYNDWNDDPPFDADNYGITVMGAGEAFSKSAVGKYVEERDRNIVAQIIRVGNDADLTERFALDKTTRVRVYAIGEGQNRQMYDYGWIENAKTGAIVWEMTYAMTFHAGGGRKNRTVNTTILLEKGEYKLRFRSDDSHGFGNWNVEPPTDQQYWGITLYRDDVLDLPPVPPAPRVPDASKIPPPRPKP